MEMQLKIVGFSGLKKDWDRWNVTFLAKARLKGYRNLLVGIDRMPSKGTKGHEDFMTKNDFAFAELLISCECDVCLGLVNISRSEEMPEGDAHIAWTKLVEKFAPTTKYNLIKTKKEFVDSKLEDVTMDPDEWIQNLEILRQRLMILGHPISEMDLIIHVMHNLPEEYENTIEIIQNEMENTDISFEKVKEKLRMKYERLSTNFMKTDKALVSFGKFKGNCTYCGVYGHKGKDCRKKKNHKKKETNNDNVTPTNGLGTQNQRDITCYKCQKKGHIARYCPTKKQKETTNEVAQVTRDYEIALVGVEKVNEAAFANKGSDEIPENLWIADSGASCHVAYKDIGMFDTAYSNSYIVVGGGTKLPIVKKGKARISFEGRDGKFREVILHDVSLVPKMGMNLFSMNRALDSGASMFSEGKALVITKENAELFFNTKVQVGNSFLLASNTKVDPNRALITSERKEIDIRKYHRMLGHPSVDSTKETAKNVGLKLTGKLEECKDCMLAKMRKKNIKKVSENTSKIPGERLMLDISYIKHLSIGQRNIWILLEDQATKMKWSFFARRKSELGPIIIEFIKKLKINRPGSAMFLRMDNAKENITLKGNLEKEGIDIHVEFTTPNTPQQNGQVERSFATLWGRVRSMLNDSGVPEELRNKLWAECALTATKLSNITSRRDKGNPFELFHGRKSKLEKDLRIFGEVGVKVARNQVNMVEKLQNKGSLCIFVGYEDNHPEDAYRVLDLKNLTMMISRDVRWLGKSYGDEFGNKSPKILEYTDLESDDDEEVIVVKSERKIEEIPKKPESRTIITRSKALMDNLEDDSSDSEGENRVYTTIENIFSDPVTFKEAYYSPNENKRALWRKAIEKELRDMEKCDVWTLIKKEEVPNNRKLIGCKWIFKEKRDGVHRARLVALGYSQVAGVDFTGNYSPVVNDSTFRLILLIIAKFGLKAWSMDIGTAFLNGNLQEEIFMRLPEGFEETNGKRADQMCLKLKKSIYGLVQAAREWNQKFNKEIVKLGYEINNVDPCLFCKREDKKFCLICLYVDDMIITGDMALMVKTVADLRKVFDVKVQYNINDFLGCEITELPGEMRLHQKRIVNKMLENVELVSEKEYKTPCGPGFRVVRPSSDEKVDQATQKWFRSNIGSLLYLVKLSRPDLCNAVRELSKVMDGATPGQVKELRRLINYVYQTREMGLKMEFSREHPWEIEAFSDSDFGGDKDGRKSVSGSIVMVSGVPISWKSKGQNTVSLSSTEAEYIALSETVREAKFISQVLEVMHIEYKKPINIHVDNIGAIFLAGNRNSSERSKHIDMKYHFVRDLIDEGLIDVKFVRSEQNLADLFTKNLNGELFELHSSKLLTE
jgi:hypothetical protein